MPVVTAAVDTAVTAAAGHIIAANLKHLRQQHLVKRSDPCLQVVDSSNRDFIITAIVAATSRLQLDSFRDYWYQAVAKGATLLLRFAGMVDQGYLLPSVTDHLLVLGDNRQALAVNLASSAIIVKVTVTAIATTALI